MLTVHISLVTTFYICKRCRFWW